MGPFVTVGEDGARRAGRRPLASVFSLGAILASLPALVTALTRGTPAPPRVWPWSAAALGPRDVFCVASQTLSPSCPGPVPVGESGVRVTACRSWPLSFRLPTPSRHCGAGVPSACRQKEALGAKFRTQNASHRLSLLFCVGGSGGGARDSRLRGASGRVSWLPLPSSLRTAVCPHQPRVPCVAGVSLPWSPR